MSDDARSFVWAGDHFMGPGWERFARPASLPPLIGWRGAAFVCETCKSHLYDSRLLDTIDCPLCKIPMTKQAAA